MFDNNFYKRRIILLLSIALCLFVIVWYTVNRLKAGKKSVDAVFISLQDEEEKGGLI